jgi:copper homeostasis protein
MSRPLVEVCVASVAECLVAERAGADRLELNSGLQLGGLTPSAGLVQRVQKLCGLPVVAMVRPRPGGFCYSECEWQTLLDDAHFLVETGIHGLAIGCLNADRSLDTQKVKQLRGLFPTVELVFHRAFDLVLDWKSTLDRLADEGVQRIMTSGFSDTVPQGLSQIAEIVSHAEGRIEVIPAGGINEQNVIEVVQRSGCNQVHGTFSTQELDPGYLDAPIRFAPNDSLRRVSEERLAAVIANLDSLATGS